jgi:hypothetical protein
MAPGAIDGFRVRYSRWSVRARMFPAAPDNIRQHILSPLGFALVTSVVELVAEDNAPMIAEGQAGELYSYGQDGFPTPEPDVPAVVWFGRAILRSS